MPLLFQLKNRPAKGGFCMGRYTCERGEFKCRYCGTVYQYSDLRDMCEGRAWFRDEPDQNMILDHLGAEVGEDVIRTKYHGDDYARPPFKAELVLTYQRTTVRDKRIIPTGGNPTKGSLRGVSFVHYAEYKIGPEPEGMLDDVLGDNWEEYASGGMLGAPIGPYHFWSRHLVEEVLRKTWPDYVIEMCRGEESDELLQALREEGYANV